MTEPNREDPVVRVERLVASGSLGRAEADRLVGAMRARTPPRGLARSDPFEHVGGGVAAGLGLGAALVAIAMARLGVRFDGLLDMHLHAGAVVPWRTAILDQVAGFVLPALMFYAVARVFARRVRLVDFFGMVGFAKKPMLLAALLTWAFAPPLDPHRIQLTPGLLIFAMASLAFVVAHVTLLFLGFRNASGLTGSKLVIGFVAMLFVAETVSKLALLLLPT